MTDLEAKARELRLEIERADVNWDDEWRLIFEAFRSVAAEARKEALEEAEDVCQGVFCPCASRIRTLAGRKEGT